jgi:putative Holliday junction resolvase
LRVLALDYGRARCGCAVSDPTGTLATPIEAIPDPAADAGLDRIAAVVRERGIERVVVGLPLRLDGGESAQTAEARAFADTLGARLATTPVELFDERLTSRLARRTPGRASEDSRAAAHLLEGWLAARAQ